MRIAVTGAGGLLGTALLRHLESAGEQVLAMSRSPIGATGGPTVRWDADEDWRRTADALAGVDVVVHAAAYIPRDHTNAAEAMRCLEVNAIGTLNLLRAVEAARVRRFVYVSGSNTLRPRSGRVREDDPVGCEQAPYYLGSKVLGEIYVRAMRRGLEGLIVRPSSIYGPGMSSGVLVTFGSRLRNGLPIVVTDGGRFEADYVWRDDVAGLLVRCAVDDRSGAVNVGSGTATPLHEVARQLCEVLHADPRLVTVEPARDSGPPSGFAAVDISRARQWYGFEPTSLPEGLRLWFGRGGAQ